MMRMAVRDGWPFLRVAFAKATSLIEVSDLFFSNWLRKCFWYPSKKSGIGYDFSVRHSGTYIPHSGTAVPLC